MPQLLPGFSLYTTNETAPSRRSIKDQTVLLRLSRQTREVVLEFGALRVSEIHVEWHPLGASLRPEPEVDFVNEQTVTGHPRYQFVLELLGVGERDVGGDA